MPTAIAGAIGLALFNLGIPLAIVNAAVFAAPFLASAAVSVGLSLAAGALVRLGASPTQQASVKPSDGQQVIKQAIPPRWKSFGTVRLTGPVFWLDSDSSTGYLYLGVMLNQGRIGGFVSYHLDDSEVAIDGTGQVTTSPYSGVVTKILTRLGEPTETAYSEINSIFSVADVRGDGVASMLLIADTFVDAETQLKNYPNGIPRFRATIDASVVWDPRVSTQDRTDESTWAWSENPVVCLLSYLLDPDGYGIPWAAISPNLDEWKAAADVCDEQIISIDAGGYENRYRVAGTYLFTDRPSTVVARFLSTFDGRLWTKSDGTVGILAGKFYQPTVTFTDAHVTGYDLQMGQDPLTAVAGVRAAYLSPAHDYREQDADPWPDGDTVMALGEERVLSLDLQWVPSHSQARRLMKRAALREAAAWRGKIRTNLAGLRAIDERYINLAISELGLSGTFEVVRLELDDAGCGIEVIAVESSIDAWDPTTEEGTAASQPILTAWTGPVMTNASTSGIRAERMAIDPVASGTQVRVSLGGHPTQGLSLTNVSIGTRSGTSEDMTGPPTQFTFNGGAAAVAAAGVVLTSDWVDFAVVAGTDVLIHTENQGGGTVRSLVANSTAYTSVTDNEYDDAAMTLFAGPSAGVAYHIVKLEVRNGG